MNLSHFEANTTALVLIDLQNGLLGMSLAPHTAEELLGQTKKLVEAFHQADGTVVRIRVDLGQLQQLPTDKPTADPRVPMPAVASEFSRELPWKSSDVVITKRQWGAFYATELDQQLRRRGIRTIVLSGVTTNFGVESTARAAFDRGYELVFVEDAMTSIDALAHHFVIANIFPYMGRVRSTADVLELLAA